MMIIKRPILLSLCFSISILHAQLKSPNEFFPHQIGAHFTPHHLLVDYFEMVSNNSDHVQVIEYGKTNEGRPLILAFISTPENLALLESIKTNHLKRAGIIDGEVDESLDRAIVWISCTVHGNEVAGSESSPVTLYKLANPENASTQSWLNNTIVILDPVLNPDGYSRYTSWYYRVAGKTIDVDPSAREHNELWPGGRTNHYYHDLNRDWAWQTQIESQQRLKVYNQWLPHVHVDLHEQGVNSPYYFAPAAQPYHSYITQWQRDFQHTIGKNHAKYFDANGWLYFTKEVFDLLYPSYGDTYPIYNGSIGMTYEQGGSGRAGRAILMDNGDTLTLKDRIDHHRTTSLSTIEVASQNMEGLIENFTDFFDKSQNNPHGEFKSFVIKASNPEGKIKALCQLLDRNGIKYGKVPANIQLESAYDYTDRKSKLELVTPFDLVISTKQPRGLLTQILLEPTTQLVDSLTYDITAWSLIYAYGLDALATAQVLDPTLPYEFDDPSFSPKENTYAYILKWESLQDAKALGSLLKKGIKVRYARTNFYMLSQEFKAGTLVITRADNRKDQNFDRKIAQISLDFKANFISSTTGFMDGGPDFGSRAYTLIDQPKVGLVIGEGTSPYSTGQVWHFFDQELNYPLQLFETDDLLDIPFSEINTLILTDGKYNVEEANDELVDWIENGGHLIVIGSATKGFTDKKAFALKQYATEAEKQMAVRVSEQYKEDQRLADYIGSTRRNISKEIPGAILKHKLDNTHPLGFGLPQHYFSLKTSNLHYDYLLDGTNVATLGQNFLSTGFIGYQIKKLLKETTTFAVEEMNNGQVTYLVDNPLYRSFWYNGKMIMSNAIFFVAN